MICKKDSDVNNAMIIYNLQTKSISHVVGVNFAHIGIQDGVVYAVSRTTGEIYELFSGYDFNGSAIQFYYESPEFDFGDETMVKDIRDFHIIGKLAQGQTVRVTFDVWDRDGKKQEDYQIYDWTPDGVSSVSPVGVSKLPVSKGAAGGELLAENHGQFRVRLRRVKKIKIRISEISKLPLELHKIIPSDIIARREVQKNNLSLVS